MSLVLPPDVARISRLRFNALAGYSRKPSTELFAGEISWYEHKRAPVLGALIIVFTDEDFGGIIMGRDEGRRMRCVDVVGWYDSPEQAEIGLIARLENWAKRPLADMEQGGRQYPFVDMFTPIVQPAKMSTAFARLLNAEGFSCGRGIIEAMMPYFEDVDSNFVEQFQSTGFDSRIWELYLFALLTEGGYVFDRQFQAPDFFCNGISQQIFVEAVTVNPTRNGNIITEPPVPEDKQELVAYFKQYMPIKWGSALTGKLRKEYWALPHVQGKPIVFAIQDFHADRSMTFTNSTLSPYLYGLEFAAYYDADGNLQVSGTPIQEHRWGDKCIESGFFRLPNSEMISGVIQNPTATISKFNRMGHLAGFGSKAVRMLKAGTAYDPDPNAALPREYLQDVNSEGYRETWSEGLNIFHNPNARYPLDNSFFPQCMNHRLINNQVVHNIPEFHPFTAETFILSPKRTEN
ncbi:MAG: hypothetical protein PHX83_12990 [Acidobacteriia bacterium]|nr:hypothetical protein [Terriglobia bacterium]